MLQTPGLADTAVAASVSAGAAWQRDADIPDPLNRADIADRPDLVAAALRRRRAAGWMLGHPHAIAYPKARGGLRTVTALDPFADLAFRQAVGEAVPAIEESLPPEVLNARCTIRHGWWSAAGWRTHHKKYRGRLADERRSGRWTAEAHLDVKRQYETTQPRALAVQLRSIGVPDYSVDAICHVLEQLQAVPGLPKGLPVGPEASAPLGTVALLGLDRVLKRKGFQHVRWADDTVVFLPDPNMFEPLCELVRHQLSLCGQALNEDKTLLVDIGDEGDLAPSGLGAAGGSDGDPAQRLERLAWLGEAGGIAYALGGLRTRADPRGVAILKSCPWITLRFPRQVANYMATVRSEVASWDFILEIVLAETTPERAGAQIWLPRILPVRDLGQALGASLFQIGASLDRRRFAPVADAMLAAAGRSCEKPGVRQKRALEIAEPLSDLNAKRAALAAFADGAPTKTAAAGLRHLIHLDPDMTPTVEWAGLHAA